MLVVCVPNMLGMFMQDRSALSELLHINPQILLVKVLLTARKSPLFMRQNCFACFLCVYHVLNNCVCHLGIVISTVLLRDILCIPSHLC